MISSPHERYIHETQSPVGFEGVTPLYAVGGRPDPWQCTTSDWAGNWDSGGPSVWMMQCICWMQQWVLV